MKKFAVVLVVLSLLALSPLAASADVPAPGGPFNTAFRVQNLSSSAANCVVDFYAAGGGSSAAQTTLPSIAVGDSAYVYVPSLSNLNPGQYSAVVSCDQEVAAVVNFSDTDSGASYSGFGQAAIANTLYAATIYNNYYSYYSDLVVQNTTGSSNLIRLDVYRAGQTDPVFTESKTAQGNGYVTFEQQGKSQLQKNVPYSAKITGAGAIAAVVNVYGSGSSAQQLYSSDAFASGSNVAYAPVIMNAYYGYNTSLIIQNVGTAQAQVTITYGTGTVKNSTIEPGAADSRYTPSEGLPAGTLTGVKVESNQPVIVVVNESTGKNRAASYEGFKAGSTTVRAPIVMKRYYKYNTSMTCQNVGDAAATMTIAYSNKTGSFTTANPIEPSKTYLFYQPGSDQGLSNNYIGSATVTSAQPVVCVVNEDMNEAPDVNQSKDMLYAYDGIGQ